MRHEDRVLELREMHRLLLAKISQHNAKDLPTSVDPEKLEKAYESIKSYAFVLKKL